MTVETNTTTLHCIRCGKSLLASVEFDTCHDCNSDNNHNICIGMIKFADDLNMIIRGLYCLDKNVGYELILSSFKSIEISRNGYCYEKCIACETFLGIQEILQTGYTTTNLTQKVTRLKSVLKSLKKNLYITSSI